MSTAGELVAVVARPAPLTAVALLVSPVPSPVIRVSAGVSAMPDSGSDAVQCTGTSVRYQPWPPSGVVVGVPDSTGAVVSTSVVSTANVVVLPATSVDVPVTVSPWATVRAVVVLPSARQVSMPDAVAPGSVQLNVTVMPLPSAAHRFAAVTTGAVRSSRTVVEAPGPTLPRRSAPPVVLTRWMPS